MTDRRAAGRGALSSPLHVVILLSVVALLLGLSPGASAVTNRRRITWAPAATAAIHPGVQTYTDLGDGSQGQCTANFVYTDGTTVYLGQAAHCAGTGQATETDGCTAKSMPLGTAVEVKGASHPGKLVYSSWLLMQANGEKDADTCAYNDLALVQLDPADAAKVNPSVPHWGGPNGLATSTELGEKIYSYGNSSLRFGISTLSPKEGYSLGQIDSDWEHTVYTATPGIPGDSGSGFLDATGKAFGVLSVVELAPLPASNGVGDLSRELAYMHAHAPGAFTNVTLALGTEAFGAGLLP